MKKFYLLIVFFIFFTSMQAIDYTIPPNTYSIQIGDFDNDGDNDIVVGHIIVDTYATILENSGNGEFSIYQYLVNTESRMFFFIDNFDENELKDFVIENEDGNLLIYYNSDLNNPYIYQMQIDNGFNKISCGDFDADGDKDLVFSSSGAGQNNLWGLMYNLGNREFSEAQWFECPNQVENADFEKFHCSDLDDNGYDDIIAFSYADTYLYYFSENEVILDSLDYQVFSSGMTSSDFDNDGDDDIVIVHWPTATTNNFKVYENLGNQEFTLQAYFFETMWSNPISIDLNCDGLSDIASVGNVNGIKSFNNLGNLEFEFSNQQMIESYGENYYRSAFADYDGNGSQDVAIIRYGISENNLTILYNDGEGYFLDEPQVNIEENEINISNLKLKISNYPNPFNPVTTIIYSLPVNVENPVIEIFNIKGEKIVTLSSAKQSIEGRQYKSTWDGTDQYRKPVSSGVYLYRVKADDFVSRTSKMLLLK